MKKFFAIALLTVASLSASAQVYLGGSVGYWHDDTADSDSFTIKPEIGYEINETWGVGTTIGYTYTKADDVKAHLFELAPYARYTYFRTDNNLLNLFVDGQVGLGIGSTKYDDDSETAVYWNIGFRPGVAININDKFSFETKFGFLGYQGADKHAEAAGVHKCGGLNFSTQELTFGFFYHF